MQHYELFYIVSIKHLEDDLQKVNDKVTALLKEAGVEITLQDTLGKQRLAYPIKQMTQGTYEVVEFNAEPAVIKKLDTQLRLTAEILRHLIVVKRVKSAEEIKREKSVQEKLKQEKEEELARLAQVTGKDSLKKEPQEKAPEVEVKAEPVAEDAVALKKKEDKPKVSLEDLDKKLDELLTEEVI